MNKDNDWFLRQKDDSEMDAVIRKKLTKSISTEYSINIIKNIKEELEKFLHCSLLNLHDSQKIDTLHKDLLTKITNISNTKIVDGIDNLHKVSNTNPYIIISNHFGIVPLTLIDNSNNKFPWPLKKIGVFPVRMVALNILSEKTNIELIEVATELPEPIATIQRSTPSILIPRNVENRTTILYNKLHEIIVNKKNVGVVMYPEGGMSGKLNKKEPYDLDKFHTGSFVLAKQLGLKILPVCQYFNPSHGFELSILEPLDMKNKGWEKLSSITLQTKFRMQNTLNSMQKK